MVEGIEEKRADIWCQTKCAGGVRRVKNLLGDKRHALFFKYPSSVGAIAQCRIYLQDVCYGIVVCIICLAAPSFEEGDVYWI